VTAGGQLSTHLVHLAALLNLLGSVLGLGRATISNWTVTLIFSKFVFTFVNHCCNGGAWFAFACVGSYSYYAIHKCALRRPYLIGTLDGMELGIILVATYFHMPLFNQPA